MQKQHIILGVFGLVVIVGLLALSDVGLFDTSTPKSPPEEIVDSPEAVAAAILARVLSDDAPQDTDQPIKSIITRGFAPITKVYYNKTGPGEQAPGVEVLATGATWMPFLRQAQIYEWNEVELELTFITDQMVDHIEEMMPQIEQSGYLMLDIENGPKVKEFGLLEEWTEGVNEAIRIAKEVTPEGTIVGYYPGPSHVQHFTDDSFGALENATGLFFPIHTMGGVRLEAFAQDIALSPYGDLPVIIYLWQFLDPPAGTPAPSLPSLWEDQGTGQWVSEELLKVRVNEALDLFVDPQFVVRGGGPQAARAIAIVQEIIGSKWCQGIIDPLLRAEIPYRSAFASTTREIDKAVLTKLHENYSICTY